MKILLKKDRIIEIIGLIIVILFLAWNVPRFRDTDYSYKQLKDPTYSEMKEFLARDQTNLNEYRDSIFDQYFLRKYVCTNFARDVKKNAIKQGIRCAEVKIGFEDTCSSHAIVCFQTIDRGFIFVEPMDDTEVRIAIGIDYFGNVISKIKIYWPCIKNN